MATDPITKPIAPPRTWLVTITVTDNPGSRETYLTKEQVTHAILYNNKVAGLYMVTSTANIVEPSLGRKAQVAKEKEK